MGQREVIRIDETLCNGCGDCVMACAEGAIAIVDGKARLVSDTYCDGLGACLGKCPQGAISIARREAAAFDAAAVQVHLTREKARQQVERSPTPHAGGCPGARLQVFAACPAPQTPAAAEGSQLRQWPMKLHLLPATAPFLHGSDLLLSADCVGFALGGFHSRLLHGRSLAIACPKLDSHQEVYLDKLIGMIDEGRIRSLTVAVMEVPCCGGLVRLAQQAVARANRTLPLRRWVVSVRGEILLEQELLASA
jgi:Pyruvate/2-oxoacid:ferredoxin oxidoreductase delta subunit